MCYRKAEIEEPAQALQKVSVARRGPWYTKRHYNAKAAVVNICPIQAQPQHRSLEYKERKARASH